MFMRFLCLLLPFALLFCSCEVLPPEPVIPDREIKEIAIYGSYYPHEEGNRPENYDPLYAKRPFNYSSHYYCYNKQKDKEPIYDQGLKVRLYDKKSGKILAEDFLRLQSNHWEFVSVVSYLPHIKTSNGEIRVVRVKEGKEDLIKIFGGCCPSHEFLFKSAFIRDFYTEFYKKRGEDASGHYKVLGSIRYDKESECYSPGGYF